MISKKVWPKVTYTIILLFAIALVPFTGVTAPSTQAAEPPQAQEAPMLPPREEPLSPGTGFRAPEMDLSHLTGQKMPEEFLVQLPGRDGEEPKAQVPPATWDWRTTGKVTSVKNQNPCGSCYAFASIGNVESKMLIDGAATLPDPDYSENNAKECNWRELNDYESPPGTPWGSCDGGNYYMLASLFSQKGVVLESCDPYVAADVACNDTCVYQKTLLDWRIISGDAVPDTNVLKSYIQSYGPVYTSMYADSSEGFDSSYNGLYTFDYSATGTNHAVLIVGWSNNLPPVPGHGDPADGWIVKNSWGASWGDSGYFYITYGSANIGMYSSLMNDWQSYDNNGAIMFYDDDCWSNGWGYGDTTAWGLAKFFPSSGTNVTRVEFWTTDVTTGLDVYLYDNFDAGALSTLLWSSPNNSFAESGYHGVVVDPPLAVADGDDVIAVVKFTNDSYNYPVPADKNGPHETGRTYLSHTGADGSWSDLGAAEQNDVAIRLRTSQEGAPSECKVLFEQAHSPSDLGPGNYTMEDIYSDWAALLQSEGMTVASISTGPITYATLSNYDVVVIPESTDTYSTDEINAIKQYVDNGGGLLILGEWGPFATQQGIYPVVNEIAAEFDMAFNDDTVYDATHNDGADNWPLIPNFDNSVIGGDVSQVAYYAGCSLGNLTAEAFPIAWAYAEAYTALPPTEGMLEASGVEMGSAGTPVTQPGGAEQSVIAGSGEMAGEGPVVMMGSYYGDGRVAAIGDGNLFGNNDADGDQTIDLYEYDNEKVAVDIVSWLCQAVGPAGVTWLCPLDHIALIAPYPFNERPFLTVSAELSQVTIEGDADWFQVLWLDESTGDWYFFFSEFTVGNTLLTLEPDEYYYVVVSEPCELIIPQG